MVRYPFLGTWAVLTQYQTVLPVSGRLTKVKIDPSSDNEYNLGELREFGIDLYDLDYSEADNTLRAKSHRQCISFWRNPAEDVIFSVKKKENGDIIEVWTARKVPEPSAIEVPSVTERKWYVKLTTGQGASPGYVTFTQLFAAGHGTGLFGLFHNDGTGDSTKSSLYDIVVYEESVGCFNSVFDVRSIHYWKDGADPSQMDLLFATFNNRFSIPETRFGEHSIGQLLPFEKAVIRQPGTLSSEHDDGDPNGDPNVGVWVGEPTGP